MQNLIAQVYAWTAAHWLVASLIALYVVLQFAYGRRSQIDAWCERRPRVAGVLKILRGLGVDPWLIIQGLTLLTKRRLPVGYVTLAEKLLKLLATGALVLIATGCGATVEVTAATAADGTRYPYCIQVTQPLNPLATRVKILGCATAESEAIEQQKEYAKLYPAPQYKIAIVRGVK